VRVIGRRWAWIPGLLLVLLFVVMTGASASVVRAAVMAVITQLDAISWPAGSPWPIVVVHALIMLWQNPLILLHDLGFNFISSHGRADVLIQADRKQC